MNNFTLIHSKEARFTAKKSNKVNINDVKEIAHSNCLLESLRNVGVRNIKAKTFTEVSSIGLTGESKTVYYFKDDELFHFIDDGKVFDAKNEKDIERQIKARFRKGLWGDNKSFYRLKIDDDFLAHHGVEGQRWGKRNGPPYPLERLVGSGEKLERMDNGKVKVVSKGSSGLSGSKAVSKQLKKEGKLPKNATSQNLDKWGKSKNTNVLYISGTSGSGKSTVANNLKNKNTEIINLDSFFDNPEGPKSKDFVSFLEKNNSEYKKLSLPKDQISINDWGKVAEKFENEIEQYGKDTFGRGKKVIVEGVQLLDDTVRPDKSYFKDKPFILINTNIITSTFRANQRDDTKFELSNIMDRLAWNKDIKNLKKENNLKHSEEDFLAHHGVEGQRWGKRNGPPYPLERKADKGEKVVRTENGGIKVVSKDENPRIKKNKNKTSQNVVDFDPFEAMDKIDKSLSKKERDLLGVGNDASTDDIKFFFNKDKTAYLITADYHGKYKDEHPIDGKIIGIAAMKEARGTGITDKLIDNAKKEFKNDRLIAEINENNIASRKLFERNNFKKVLYDNGVDYYIYDKNVPHLKEFNINNVNNEFIKKYGKDAANLKGYNMNINNRTGKGFVDKAGNLVGYAIVNSKDGYLSNIEVTDKYKGQGYGDQIMKYAINNMNVNKLYVEKNNNVAINMYKKNGFEIDKDGTRNGYYLMKLTKNLNGYTAKDVQKIFDKVYAQGGEKQSHKDYDATIYRNVNKGKGFIEMYRSKDGNNIGTIAVEVVPDQKRKGIGKSLVNEAINNAESLGLNRLEWYCKKSNEASVALAKSCGFKIDKSLSDDEWYTLALNLGKGGTK